MRTTNYPCSKDLVLIGGGHAHALLLLKWAMKPLPGVRLTLINPQPTAPYTGMLPGYVAGHYALDELTMDLVRIAQYAGVRFVLDDVVDVDPSTRRIKRKHGPDIHYDVMSLNVGITLALNELEGFERFGTPAKPLGLFARQWNAFLRRIRTDSLEPNVVVLGAGVGGVELALAMKCQLDQASPVGANLTIIESQDDILGEINSAARQRIIRQLDHYEIGRLCQTEAHRIDSSGVTLTSGEFLKANFVVGAAGAKSHDWIRQTGLPNSEGFVIVDQYLRSTHPDQSIFAVGDCAVNPHSQLPRAGVYAVRQAPVLFKNLRAALTGKPLAPYRPQKDFLKIISTGRKNGVAVKFGLTFEGSRVWRWKDRIDRKFMNRFVLDITPPKLTMPREVATGSQELFRNSAKLCAGCGAKVARKSLDLALKESLTDSRPEWSEDAAEIQLANDTLVISTDHLRSFMDDHSLFTRICALHAMSDVWARGVQPQYALASVTLPHMSERLQTETLREIMQAAHQTCDEVGVKIVGGHTAQGPELTIGFTVIGDKEHDCVSQCGAQAGDNILLTKPLGTGVILAGYMQGRIGGNQLYETLAVMAESSRLASKLLAPVATAMTDVTGFGLAGHLMNILTSSGKCATLHLSDIPFLNGALELTNQNVKSTLWQSNFSVADLFSDLTDPKSSLLFDPQTSGGLLATVPENKLNGVVTQLNDKGLAVHNIGTVCDGSPFVRVL